MSKPFNGNLARIQYLIATRKAGDLEKIQRVETEFVSDIVGKDVLARDAHVRPKAYATTGYLTPFAATEAFADALREAIAIYAGNIGSKLPGTDRYNPLFASPAMLRGTWESRQVVDELGIPYWFFAHQAVLFWSTKGHDRVPRPSQLCEADVLAHVIGLWADPYSRYHYPWLGGESEPRFLADHFVGDRQQLAYLSLIEQRLADAEALGHDRAAGLSRFIEVHISQEEAERRFGPEVIGRALQLRSEADRSLAELLEMTPGLPATVSGQP